MSLISLQKSENWDTERHAQRDDYVKKQRYHHVKVEGWKDAFTSQEMPKIASKSSEVKEWHGTDSVSQPSGEINPANIMTLDF